MLIHPISHMIRHQNKSVQAMLQSMCLASGWETNCKNKVGTYQSSSSCVHSHGYY